MSKAEALDKIEQLAYSYDKGKIESMRDSIDSVLEQYAQQEGMETIEKCKEELLKQLHPMIYRANTYPCEAVSKATILSLDKLVSNHQNQER